MMTAEMTTRGWTAHRIGSVAAILLAGAVAYVSYAAGAAGPMVAFGRGDADIAAADAWVQVPVHVAVALGIAVAESAGVRGLAWAASIAVLVALGLFTAYLVVAGLSSFGDYADLLDVAVSAVLLMLYVGATTLSVSALRPRRST